MRTGGQNIKSVEDHKAKGNYRPVRHANRTESVVKTIQSIPKPPGYFDKREVNLWETTCKDVIDLGVMSICDTRMIEMYVSHWFLWRDAVDNIKENGFSITVESGGKASTIRNPAIQVMNESSKIVAQISDRFGFSPKSRMGIKVPGGTEKEDAGAKFFDN